ncbi:N-acetylmuramidase domain-containing protein [Bacteroides timonensis]|uniref:N-acetylmuramidase domain-containing protein n=1 Tax=Bacteroides timonensis TaxID=1470345 RepID=UPI0005C465B9|nr:N-acetylmuramidase domain-containing protein [Bacteroides timonensis]
MCESEYKQLLLLFANFIKNNPPMLRALQSKDWVTFAKCYNGLGYVQNRYNVKLEVAYRKFEG